MLNCRVVCLQEILKIGMKLYDYGMTEHLRLFTWVVFTVFVFNTKVTVVGIGSGSVTRCRE